MADDPYGPFKTDLVASLNAQVQRAGLSSGAAVPPAGGGSSGGSAVLPTDTGTFLPVDAAGVGDFPWRWNNFENFSADTWAYLNTIAAKSDEGYITFTAGLTTWYYNVISATAYLWTDADTQQINALLAKSRGVQQALVSAYVAQCGTILPHDRAQAAAALNQANISSLGFVVQYRIAYQWSGREAAGQPPLSPAEVRAADLPALFSHAPDGAQNALLPVLQQAFQHEAAWSAALDDLWNRARAIRDAADNTHSPSSDNNSGRLIYWTDGTYAEKHAFDVVPAPNDIEARLSSQDTIEVTFTAQRDAQGGVSLALPGGTATPVSGDVLSVGEAGHAPRDLFAHDGTGDVAQITMRYHGPAEITVAARPFDAETSTGWYFEHPITQAATNLVQNVLTGYQFQVPIAIDDEHWAEFGLLRKLLVCRKVELRVTYPQGDAKRLAASVPAAPGDHLALLGKTHVKGTKTSPVTAHVHADGSSGIPTLVLSAGPPGQAGTPPEHVHVIGAQLSNPFPDIEPLTAPAPKPPIAVMSRRVNPSAGGGMLLSKTGGAPSLAEIAGNMGLLDPGADLVAAYEAEFGQIDETRLRATRTATTLDYVLTVVFGLEWSGRTRAEGPLAVDAMRKARRLRDLFPKMPLEAAPILTELHRYLSEKS